MSFSPFFLERATCDRTTRKSNFTSFPICPREALSTCGYFGAKHYSSFVPKASLYSASSERLVQEISTAIRSRGATPSPLSGSLTRTSSSWQEQTVSFNLVREFSKLSWLLSFLVFLFRTRSIVPRGRYTKRPFIDAFHFSPPPPSPSLLPSLLSTKTRRTPRLAIGSFAMQARSILRKVAAAPIFVPQF